MTPRKWATGAAIAGVIVVSITIPAGAWAQARLDPSFGTGGTVVESAGLSSVRDPAAIALDGKDRMVVVAVNDLRSHPWEEPCDGMLAVRYLENGEHDPGFSDDGFVAPSGVCEYPRAVTTAPDGSVITASADLDVSHGFIRRWGPDGSVSSRGSKFGRSPEPPADIALDSRERILIANEGKVTRLLADGELDPDFRFRQPPLGGPIVAVKPLGNGRIVFAGSIRGRLLVRQLRNDGRPDRGFGRSGTVAMDLDGSSKCACTTGTVMVRDYQRRIIVAAVVRKRQEGKVTSTVLVRLLPGGRRDRSFGQNGVERLHLGRFDPTGLAIQRNGKIVLGGTAARGTFEHDGLLVRLNTGGGPDQRFFGAGFFETSPGGSVNDVVVDRKERIVTVGTDEYGQSKVTRILPS